MVIILLLPMYIFLHINSVQAQKCQFHFKKVYVYRHIIQKHRKKVLELLRKEKISCPKMAQNK